MKRLCILTLLFFMALPVFYIFAACEELRDSLSAAEAAKEKAQWNLRDLYDQRRMNFVLRIGKSIDRIGKPKDMGDFADDISDAANVVSLRRQIEAAEAALDAANQAYSTAYYDFMVCYTNHLLEEITGPCGHTYQRLHRSDHSEVVGMCGHTYYYCQTINHGFISIYPCSKCGAYYFTCASESCMAGGSHH